MWGDSTVSRVAAQEEPSFAAWAGSMLNQYPGLLLQRAGHGIIRTCWGQLGHQNANHMYCLMWVAAVKMGSSATAVFVLGVLSCWPSASTSQHTWPPASVPLDAPASSSTLPAQPCLQQPSQKPLELPGRRPPGPPHSRGTRACGPTAWWPKSQICSRCAHTTPQLHLHVHLHLHLHAGKVRQLTSPGRRGGACTARRQFPQQFPLLMQKHFVLRVALTADNCGAWATYSSSALDCSLVVSGLARAAVAAGDAGQVGCSGCCSICPALRSLRACLPHGPSRLLGV